jgi:hypothetical protein
MDRITQSLLDEFSAEQDLNKLPQDERFEHLTSYIAVRRHYNQTLDTFDIVVGQGGDTGIDAIAIVVNGSLVTDAVAFEEQFGRSDYLDVTFLFVQADQGPSFDGAKIGNFGFGVRDFFKETPTLQRNGKVSDAAAIMTAIYKRSSKFIRGNPVCRLYFITTGQWTADPNLEARRRQEVTDLNATGNFRDVDFQCLGANGIQRLYNQTRNAIGRDFVFTAKIDVPQITGVNQAYLGFLPKDDFLPLITDDSGEMLRSIFYDNVRDFQDYNPVNSEIQATLASPRRERFVLMNNGVTIIARTLTAANTRFHIADYQIVNGCQTCHVVFDERKNLDSTVLIPVRLIYTQDDDVIESIIRATNRQTEVKPEQFAAITDFAKRLELFFSTYPEPQRLFYERRQGQYDRLQLEKTRIVTQPNMARAFAAMFMEEPHRTVRSYKSLTAQLGQEIFAPDHRLEPYQAAAFAFYRLDFLWRNLRLDPKYKAARYHMLLAVRYLVNQTRLPQMNSREMERRANEIIVELSDAAKAEGLYLKACAVIDAVAKGDFTRDNIHTQKFTENLVKQLQTTQRPQLQTNC